jgi:hypothetical protein
MRDPPGRSVGGALLGSWLLLPFLPLLYWRLGHGSGPWRAKGVLRSGIQGCRRVGVTVAHRRERCGNPSHSVHGPACSVAHTARYGAHTSSPCTRVCGHAATSGTTWWSCKVHHSTATRRGRTRPVKTMRVARSGGRRGRELKGAAISQRRATQRVTTRTAAPMQPWIRHDKHAMRCSHVVDKTGGRGGNPGGHEHVRSDVLRPLLEQVQLLRVNALLPPSAHLKVEKVCRGTHGPMVATLLLRGPAQLGHHAIR